MKLIQKDIWILLFNVFLLLICLFLLNTKIALVISMFIGFTALLNKKAGLLSLVIFISVRPFLVEINPGLKVMGDIIIFMLLIRTLFDYRKDIKSLLQFNMFEIAFFCFGIIGVISALIHGVDVKAIIVQLRAYYLFYCIFYVVKRLNITSKDIFHFSMTTFIISCILSLQGIIEKISNRTLMMPTTWENWHLSATNQIRVYGLLKGPNELSLYLIIGFLVSFYLLKKFSGIKRFIIYTGLVLMGTTILLTYSRGAYLCIAGFLIVYLLLNRNIKKLIPVVLIGVLSAGLFLGVTKASSLYYDKFVMDPISQQGDSQSNEENDQGLDRFKGAFSDESIAQSNTSGRIYYVKKALEVLKDNPVIGSGYATFGGSATLKYSSPIYKHYHINYNFYSDNQYVLILAETGVLGVLSLVVALFYLGSFTWNKRNTYFYSPVMLFFFTSTVVGGLVYNILENDSFMLNYFIILGFAFNYFSKSKNDLVQE
jgi:putative inorganic carbon (hco3(-)) transporter